MRAKTRALAASTAAAVAAAAPGAAAASLDLYVHDPSGSSVAPQCHRIHWPRHTWRTPPVGTASQAADQHAHLPCFMLEATAQFLRSCAVGCRAPDAVAGAGLGHSHRYGAEARLHAAPGAGGAGCGAPGVCGRPRQPGPPRQAGGARRRRRRRRCASGGPAAERAAGPYGLCCGGQRWAAPAALLGNARLHFPCCIWSIDRRQAV